MKKVPLKIDNIPAVLFGEPSDCVFLYVHGKCGCKEEAEDFANTVAQEGWQVLSFDLPGHGQRKNSPERLVPWETVPELRRVSDFINGRFSNVSLYANSIGAYFSLLAFPARSFEHSLLVSPVLDMPRLIEGMMFRAGVSGEQLRDAGEIPVDGEVLSWRYYTYAREHTPAVCSDKTAILYAGHDDLTSRDTVTSFARLNGCSLEIYEDGEHWFHTPAQLGMLRSWVKAQLLK